MDARIRRVKVDLMTIGTGVIAFGAWTFIKCALSVLMIGVKYDETLSDAEITALNIVMWIMMILIFLIHFYIGVCARAESRDKRKTAFYLILTGLVSIFELAMLISEIVLLFTTADNTISLIVTLIIDTTSLVFMAELMINAVRLRRWRKRRLHDES